MKKTIAALIIMTLLLIGCDRGPATNPQGVPFPTIEPAVWEAMEP